MLYNPEDLFVRDARDPKKVMLQALIYTWGLEDKYPGTPTYPAIYDLHRIFADNFSGDIVLKKEKEVVDFPVIQPEFEENLYQLVREIYAEDTVFRQTAFPEKCKYCTYNTICRRY